MDLKKYIIDKSKQIGIDTIGFTNADDFSEISEFLESRKEKNYQTEFEESYIEKRVSPKLILDSAKSIIVIGVSYFLKTKEESEDRARGKLSKSSLGVDYHTVLTEKMEKLITEIEKIEDFEYKTGVDTTPLIDRFLAKRSGIGWYGKNSNIINDKLGSFIFLGYIITDLDIEQDLETEEKCGNCDLCIRYCPVGAIKQNYELNATRCISYLTQTKSVIPYDLRDKMGTRIYGCDTCQLVCPKNKDIMENAKNAIELENIIEYLDIEEIFFMSNREFKKKYGDVAFSWRGKNIIKRNCIITLGNLKDMKNMYLLESALKDQSAMIRNYAAWAILKIDRDIGIELLDEHKNHESDSCVIDEIENLKSYFKISKG